MTVMTEPRIIVVSPANGRRCPAWIEGEDVVALCGPISVNAPIYVERDGRKYVDRFTANELVRKIQALGYRYVRCIGKKEKVTL